MRPFDLAQFAMRRPPINLCRHLERSGGVLNDRALRASAVVADPFPYFVTRGLLALQELRAVVKDFPKIDMGGLFLPESFPYGPAFASLLAELEGPEVRRIVGEKLGIDLTGRPTMITLRSNCQAKDGRIHADATFKLATLLLYLNENWADEGGKLRVLRSGADIEDYAAEVAPEGGLAFCFRVQPNSWHGHKPFVGPRRYVMLNYCADAESRDREVARHRWSNRVKKFKRLLGAGRISQAAA
jgi:SM-20-related protein